MNAEDLKLDIVKYPEINSVFKRDGNGNFITGKYAIQEIEYLKRCSWLFTEKIHGTNIRVHIEDGQVYFKGRTERAEIPTFLLNKLHDLFPDGSRLPNMTLFGEGYGRKIQKEGTLYNKDGVDFILFDVLYDDYKWLSTSEMEKVADYLGIRPVPTYGVYDLCTMLQMIRNGALTSFFGKFRAEGVVGVPTIPLRDRYGRLIKVKIKHCDFGHSMRLEG